MDRLPRHAQLVASIEESRRLPDAVGGNGVATLVRAS